MNARKTALSIGLILACTQAWGTGNGNDNPGNNTTNTNTNTSKSYSAAGAIAGAAAGAISGSYSGGSTSTAAGGSGGSGGAGGAGGLGGTGGTSSAAAGDSSASTGSSTSAGGSGGSANGTNSMTYSEAAIPAATFNTTKLTGTTTVRNTPDVGVIVPGATVPCFAAYGASVSTPGLGIGLGGGMMDKDCTAREDARTLVAMGLTQEAVNRLCERDTMRKALGSRCPAEASGSPYKAPAGVSGARVQPAATSAYIDRVGACKKVPNKDYGRCMAAAKG